MLGLCLDRFWLSATVLPLRVVIPLQFFRSSDVLLKHDDLTLIWEYYLRENLAVGLLRDAENRDEFGGIYTPVLARSWHRESLTTWKFFLREELRWSNGERIFGTDIASFILSLRQSNAPHIVLLRDLTRVGFDPNTNSIDLEFSRSVGKELLHELALADASLLHSRNYADDWSITSGPYFVNGRSKEARTVYLQRNVFSPLTARMDAPIELTEPEGFYLSPRPMKDAVLDVFMLPVYSFRRELGGKIESLGRIWKGQAVRIYFFRFGSAHPFHLNRRARIEFASIIREALSGRVRSDVGFVYHQMVPVGYDGYLDQNVPDVIEIQELRGKHITVVWDLLLENTPEVWRSIVEAAHKHEVTILPRFLPSAEARVHEGSFAVTSNFVGNQRDALGSWSYLFSRGGLQAFRDSINGSLERVAKGESIEASIHLHREILREALAVPFFCELNSFISSPRVDLSRINPLDQRLRLYEIEWD